MDLVIAAEGARTVAVDHGPPRYRLLAVLMLAALAAPGLGALVADYGSTEAAIEKCVAGPDCESGDCGEDSPLSRHDHCCQSTCWTHAAWVLSGPAGLGVPVQSTGVLIAMPTQKPRLDPGLIFHPPRS